MKFSFSFKHELALRDFDCIHREAQNDINAATTNAGLQENLGQLNTGAETNLANTNSGLTSGLNTTNSTLQNQLAGLTLSGATTAGNFAQNIGEAQQGQQLGNSAAIGGGLTSLLALL